MLNKILCVDDAADIRAVLQISLEMLGGFSICLCASGQEALNQAVDFQPDLILMDVMMPDLDGPQTLKLLREKTEQHPAPVIFMTGQDQHKQTKALYELGAIGVISKPFQPAELANQINSIWSDYHQSQ